MFRTVLLCVFMTILGAAYLTHESAIGAALPALRPIEESDFDSFTVEDSFVRATQNHSESVLFPKAPVNFAYTDVVVPLSKKHGVDWRLVTAVIAAESGFRRCPVSPKGAVGLMQLLPRTALDYKVKSEDLCDPTLNITAGVLHLRRLNQRFKGNLKLTVAAYNAGEGVVQKFGGIPPFKETRDYVKKVLAFHRDLRSTQPDSTGRLPVAKLASLGR